MLKVGRPESKLSMTAHTRRAINILISIGWPLLPGSRIFRVDRTCIPAARQQYSAVILEVLLDGINQASAPLGEYSTTVKRLALLNLQMASCVNFNELDGLIKSKQPSHFTLVCNQCRETRRIHTEHGKRPE